MPFLPPSQQRQSTEGTSTKEKKKRKNSPGFCQVLKEMHTKENWFFFAASWCRMTLLCKQLYDVRCWLLVCVQQRVKAASGHVFCGRCTST